jgi:hypothetical protein
MASAVDQEEDFEFFLNMGENAPKVTLATNSERAQFEAAKEQTGDLSLLTRVPDEVVEQKEVAAAAPAVAPPAPKAKRQTVKAAAAPAVAQAAAVTGEIPRRKRGLSRLEGDPVLKAFAEKLSAVDTANPYKDQEEAPVYPLQSRLGFQKQILKVFNEFIKIPEFGKEPDFDACKKQGAAAAQEIEMYEYQKFVREYVRQATPYRGLLVYHGLGSGKTCSAIAAAEALFSVSKKKIIIMTPASLRDNFIREVTFCGFRHFRFNNHWTKLDLSDTKPLHRLFAREFLGIAADFLKDKNHIWLPDFTKPPNFGSDEISGVERQEITQQILHQITQRIRFINYNGITPTKLKQIACAPPDEDGNYFFDNAVIVIDEIHNLVRMMQGTIEPYLSVLQGAQRKIPFEPIAPGHWEPALCKKVTDPRRPHLTNYKRGYLLYRMLVGAKNSKIIGLSGTPLINVPEEIAILINMLAGYIDSTSFTLTPASDVNKAAVEKILRDHPHVDFEEVKLEGLNLGVFFTVLPQGMVKAVGEDGVLGVQRLPPDSDPTPSMQELTAEIVQKVSEKGMKLVRPAEFKAYPLLPPISKEFREAFISEDGKRIKNGMVLRKRLQGLISYYRGSKKELMPLVTKDEVVRIPFTPYAQAEYQRVRGEELKKEQEKKKKPSGGQLGFTGKAANLWADIYELAKMKQSNSYRMFSRQACNFSFPEGIARPRPRNQQDAVAELGTDKDFADGGAGDGRDTEGKAAVPAMVIPDEEGEDFDEAKEQAEGEDDAIDAGAKAGAGEEDEAEGKEAEGEDQVLIGELPPVAEGMIAAAPAPAVAAPAGATAVQEVAPGPKKTLSAANRLRQQRAKEAEDCKAGLLPGEEYSAATRRAKKCLVNFASPKLRLYPPGKNTIQEYASKAPMDPNRLFKYSPKFATILEKILEAPGSSLVYSQFLEMEGIGIFKTILDINEFEPIQIEVEADGSMRFSEKTIASFKKGKKIYRYLTFTGGDLDGPAAQPAAAKAGERRLAKAISQKTKIRNISLRVFNARYSEDESGVGKYPELPESMSKVLVDSGFKGNLHGELCRVFAITSAGAEGLSLRNVRRVHIMEPYWNHVRTDQVKGRAVRICSHIDLDYNEDPAMNERTVEVFTYCSTFDPQALVRPDGTGGFPRIDQTILNGDGLKPEEAAEMGFPVPAGIKDYVMTSDEYIQELSDRKKKLLVNIQNVMKSSAVDCKINQYENEEEGIACVAFPGRPEQYAYHPILKNDIAETSVAFPEGRIPVEETAFPPEAEAEAGDEAEAVAFDLGAAPAAAQAAPAAALAKPQARGPPTIKARVIRFEGTQYIAVPDLQKGQIKPLFYKIYARGDMYRTRQIGTTVADAEGLPTSEVVLF